MDQEADIEDNPLDRAHQEKLILFKQEISVITETLEKQSKILYAIPTSNRSQQPLRTVADRRRSSTYDRDYGRDYDREYDHDYYRGYERNLSTQNHHRVSSSSRVEPEKYSRYDGVYYSSPHFREEIVTRESPTQSSQSQLSPTDAGGYRALLAQDCAELIDKRIRDFRGMNEKALDLERWVTYSITSSPAHCH